MKYYLAPMEGITRYIYRNAYHKYFNNIDKYFTPFVVPNTSRNLKTKEMLDILPENNNGLYIVPQILTNDSKGFIDTARKIQQLGYKEINLNLGCPSGTVVSKGRGSGFLAHKEELDRFLDEIYKVDDMKISIKTRLGKDNPEEFYDLIKIYNKYPLEELIIHPRTREDFYGNKPNLEIFKSALESSTNPVCYNGDVFTKEDYNKLTSKFPKLDSVMIGRGLIANPGLIDEIESSKMLNEDVLRNFHEEVLNGYLNLLKDDKNTLFKMKEIWSYMIYIFSDNKKYAKKIKKSQKLRDYNEVIESLFKEQKIVKGAGLFSNK